MFSTVIALSALVLVKGGPQSWEKVYEATAPGEWIAAVWAVNRDEWFVGGSWGVTRVNGAGRQRRETPAVAIEGFFGENANTVFALGTGELVLRFTEEGWLQEHAAARLPKRGSRQNDLLHSAAYFSPDDRAPLVAFGPNLVLQRREDGTWIKPSEPIRTSLSALAETGPSERPPGCRRDAWFWLGRDVAWLSCRDRRSFTYESGQFTARGKIPSSCGFVLRVTYAHDSVYLVCAEHELWKAEGQSWQPLPRPEGRDHEYFSISLAGKCVFLTGRRTVWRRCEP